MRSATLLALSATWLVLVPTAHGESPVPFTIDWVQLDDGQTSFEGVPPLSASFPCTGGGFAVVDVTVPAGKLQVDWSTDAASCPRTFYVRPNLSFSVPAISQRLVPIAFRLKRVSGPSSDGLTALQDEYVSQLLGDDGTESFRPTVHLNDYEDSRSWVSPLLSGDSIRFIELTLLFSSLPGPASESATFEAVLPTFPAAAPALSGWGRAAVTALLVGGAGIWFANRSRGREDRL